MATQERAIIRLLRKIKDNQETPSETDGASLGLSKASNWLSITNIIVACVGIGLIIYQVFFAESKVARFNDLITKDSAILSLTEIQLLRNAEIQKQIDNSNKNKFIAAIFKLGSVIGTEDYAKSQVNDGSCIGCGDYLIRDVLPIFESQMNNPYLYQDDSMLRLWVNAYVHLNIVGQGELYLAAENGDIITTERGEKIIGTERAKSRIDDITRTKIKRDAVSVWDAANQAYLYCGNKLKIETAKFIRK